ncbi:MAG: stage II sporulation protein M [Eubacteriales bacterium]|nr:stage II sporulation protein M [Eubacteriales bacterium]
MFDNKVQYLLLVFFLVVGITAGTFTVSNMKISAKAEFSEYINLLFYSVKTNPVDYFCIFINSFLQNTVLFAIITVFSLMMIGVPVITVVLIIKGFCVGFTVGVLALNLGSGGLAAIVFCTFIPNLVFLPCLCKAGVLGLNNSIVAFKNRKIPKTARDVLISSRPHFAKMFKVYLFSLIGVILDTLLIPALIKLI